MLWAVALLLAFLAPASQSASNLEWRKRSVTGQTGATVEITCDIVVQTSTYLHWYRHLEGKAPQHLLHYNTRSSKFWVDSGINQVKYDGYAGRDKSYKLKLHHLEESDSGVYYCVTWDRHGDSDFLYPVLKTACGC